VIVGIRVSGVLGSSPFIAFLAAADLGRARAFFEGTLGLAMVEETPFACVFDAGGTMLRVTRVDEVVAAPYTVAGWEVADLAAAVAELAARKVPVCRYEGLDQDADGIWRAPSGTRVVWFADPDGNVLSLAQPPA
jgi:catechol 2,3-dioxygenase-like lactoylglutathione lyase family enzyme